MTDEAMREMFLLIATVIEDDSLLREMFVGAQIVTDRISRQPIIRTIPSGGMAVIVCRSRCSTQESLMRLRANPSSERIATAFHLRNSPSRNRCDTIRHASGE